MSVFDVVLRLLPIPLLGLTMWFTEQRVDLAYEHGHLVGQAEVQREWTAYIVEQRRERLREDNDPGRVWVR